LLGGLIIIFYERHALVDGRWCMSVGCMAYPVTEVLLQSVEWHHVKTIPYHFGFNWVSTEYRLVDPAKCKLNVKCTMLLLCTSFCLRPLSMTVGSGQCDAGSPSSHTNHHRLHLTGTELYCLITETRVWTVNNFPSVVSWSGTAGVKLASRDDVLIAIS